MNRITIALTLVAVNAALFLALPDELYEQGAKPGFQTGETSGSAERADAEDTSRKESPNTARDTGATGRRRAEGGAAAPLPRLPPREPLSSLAEPKAEPEQVKARLLPRPIPLDPGRLKVGDGIIILPGIEAPTSSQTCGTGGSAWPCGARARTAFRSYVRGRSVECMAPKHFGEAAETITTACTLVGKDLGEWVIANGWAKALADGPYAKLQDKAQRERRGIWR